jgi:hypothetical protein
MWGAVLIESDDSGAASGDREGCRASHRAEAEDANVEFLHL